MENCKKIKRKFFDKQLLSLDSPSGKLSLFALSLPLFATLISNHFIGMLQTVLASRYEGGFFVIPISVSNSLLTVLSTILALVPSGCNILLSFALGKGNKKECEMLCGTAVTSLLAFSLILLPLAYIFAEPLLKLMASDGSEFSKYIPYALVYFRIRLLSLVLSSLYTVLNGVLQCYGYTKVGFVCGLVINGSTAAFTALALFVMKIPPDLAASTFGWISVVSTFLGVSIAAAVVAWHKIKFDFKFSAKCVKRIFYIGFPASLSNIFYALSQMVTTSICLKLTEDAYLAKNYVGQIVYFVHQFGYSIGQAAAIMVGRLCGLGEYDKADRFTRQNYFIVVGTNCLSSLLFFALGKPLVSLFFNASEGVLSYVPALMLIDIVVEAGRGMNHVGQLSLNAAGDVKFTTVVSIVSCWLCGVALAYLLGISFGLGVYGIWIAFAFDELFRGILYYLRWKKQRWRQAFTKEMLK